MCVCVLTDDVHARVRPTLSVMVMMVLLKVALMCTMGRDKREEGDAPLLVS